MIKTLSFILTLGVVASSASAMPLIQAVPLGLAGNNVLNVKIICEQSGYCYQQGRRPVARWVYGGEAFYGPGPYYGPSNYGWPGKHWAWWAFLKP